MSVDQLHMIRDLLSGENIDVAHHGDCIGADQEFHEILRDLGGFWIVGHPPIKVNKRAFCDFDAIEDPKDFLDRNHDIVDAVDCMLFTPKEFREQLRSGTWATIRYCRKVKKAGLIVWPDGRTNDVEAKYAMPQLRK